MPTIIRLLLATLLGVSVAVLVSCGGSGSGLIPSAKGTLLQADFEAVAHAAESGNGSCTATESALGKTEQDFLKLPTSVDLGLRTRLQQGISNLHKRALSMCVEPTATATSTTHTETTTTAPTTSTETTPAPTTTTPTATSTQTTPTVTTPPGQSGGTEAGEGEGEGAGKGDGKGKAKDELGPSSGGASAGGGQ